MMRLINIHEPSSAPLLSSPLPSVSLWKLAVQKHRAQEFLQTRSCEQFYMSAFNGFFSKLMLGTRCFFIHEICCRSVLRQS